MYLTVSGTTTAGDLQAGNVYVMQKAPTYASLATTDSVLRRATARLTDGTDVGDLKATISATARAQSGIIDVFGSGSDPRQVAARTNAVAAALVNEIASAKEQPASVGTGGGNESRSLAVTASIAEAAEVPAVAVAPQPRYNVFAGIIVGLALAIALLVLRYALDTRIYTLSDLPSDRSLVTRTSIPPRAGRLGRGVTREVQLESFRALRANLQFGTDIGRSIAVAPVGPEADAGWVAEELSKVFAEIGLKVLLVELDLRPRIATGKASKGSETPVRSGVAQLLTRNATLDEVTTTKPTESGVLHSISAGPTTDRSSQLLSTGAMRETLTEFERSYSCVILLCPPLVERADATVVAALASSTLVVVRGGATKRAPLRFALGLLSGVRARSVSVVLENAQVS